jgi:Flp pilus assembly protein TadD
MSQDSPQAALAVLLPVKDSVNPRALDVFAQAYLKLGRHAEASNALMKLQKANAKRAILLLNSALHLEPGAIELIDALGWIKLQQKDTKGALEQLRRAHSLRPSDGGITFHLVQALDASGDRNSAKTMLKDLLKSGVNFDDLPKAQQLSATWR